MWMMVSMGVMNTSETKFPNLKENTHVDPKGPYPSHSQELTCNNNQTTASIYPNQSMSITSIPSTSNQSAGSKRNSQWPKVNVISWGGLIGSLQYSAAHTRADLSSALSHLQSEINKATVGTLATANKVLHNAKKHSDVTIKIKPIKPEDLRFIAYSDASFASTSKPESHAGMIIMATHKEISNNQSCDVSPISWGTRKIQRVVTSTLSAETSSLSLSLYSFGQVDLGENLLGLDSWSKSRMAKTWRSNQPATSNFIANIQSRPSRPSHYRLRKPMRFNHQNCHSKLPRVPNPEPIY